MSSKACADSFVIDAYYFSSSYMPNITDALTTLVHYVPLKFFKNSRTLRLLTSCASKSSRDI
jgi:hypothetical protein